jgi:hypothetical protein
MRAARVWVLLAVAAGCGAPAPQSKPKEDASSGAPAIVIRPPPANIAPPEPSAVAARAETIRRDAAAIRAQCQAAAAGDWSTWEQTTKRYREDLNSKLAPRREREGKSDPGLKNRPLAGLGDFPLFEIRAWENLNYLTDPESFADFRATQPVVVAKRWLRRCGVDLIFVPVPKMAEVYIESFVDPAPADGVIAPYTRQTLLEMLEDGVEVVDVFSLFRPCRAPDPGYLYNTADTHWAPRGMQIAAKEVAARVERYSFGKAARRAPPIVKEVTEPYLRDLGMGCDALSEQQRQKATEARTRTWSNITSPVGASLDDDVKSPVFVVGNSYVTSFREILIREMNLRVRTSMAQGSTTEPVCDFLVFPEFLSGVRVVVWITTEQHMTHFKPLPAPFLSGPRDAD